MRQIVLNLKRCAALGDLYTMESVLRNMNTRLPKLIFLVALLLVIPPRFVAVGPPADSPDSLADPGKYSDDWRANGGRSQCGRGCRGTQARPEEDHLQDETAQRLPQDHRASSGVDGRENQRNQNLNLWHTKKAAAASTTV